MKKFIMLLFASLLMQTVYAANKPELKLVGLFPEPGSTVSNGDFYLQFDLQEVYDTYGYDENFGIFVSGYSVPEVNICAAIRLFHGEDANGELIQTLYDYEVYGDHEEFQTGDRFYFSFDESKLISGETYAINLCNFYGVGKKYEDFYGPSYSEGLNFTYQTGTPITYTFKYESDAVNFGVLNWSEKALGSIDTLDELEVIFSKPVEVVENATAKVGVINKLLSDQSGRANYYLETTINKSEENPNSIIMNFNGTSLFTDLRYRVMIPSGMVYDKENPSLSNDTITRDFFGTHIAYIEAESIQTYKDENGFFDRFDVKWKCDEPIVFSMGNIRVDGGLEDESFIATPISREGMTTTFWTTNVSAFRPNKKIRFKCVPEDVTRSVLHGEYGASTSGLKIREFNFEFQTSALDEVPVYPEVKLLGVGLPTLNYTRDVLPNGYSTDYLNTLEIAIERYESSVNSLEACEIRLQDGCKAYFYKVGGLGETLIKEIPVYPEIRGTYLLGQFYVLVCPIDMKLPYGNRYKLRIPANSVRPFGGGYSRFSFYVRSQPLEFDIIGTYDVDDSGVDDMPDSTTHVIVNNGAILVLDAKESDQICVYTASGQMVECRNGADDTIQIPVPKGMYIVTVNNRATKIVI